MLDRLLLISVGKTPIEKTHESFSAPPTKHDAVTRSKKKENRIRSTLFGEGAEAKWPAAGRGLNWTGARTCSETNVSIGSN